MSFVELTKDETVAVLTMSNGENRHNPQYAAAMLEMFDTVEKDEGFTSVVIASSDPKNWSQGIDLAWITDAYTNKRYQEIKDFMYSMNRIFKRILLYPMPVIAAMGGHTFGNGSMLACSCDFRFMKADRGFFCFPEVDISIPFLPGMFALTAKAFPYIKLNEAVLTGKRMGAAELEACQVIVKACENDEDLMRESLAFAKSMQKKRPIFAEMKKRFHKPIIDIIDQEDPPIIESVKLIM